MNLSYSATVNLPNLQGGGPSSSKSANQFDSLASSVFKSFQRLDTGKMVSQLSMLRRVKLSLAQSPIVSVLTIIDTLNISSLDALHQPLIEKVSESLICILSQLMLALKHHYTE